MMGFKRVLGVQELLLVLSHVLPRSGKKAARWIWYDTSTLDE